jgi:hypothetical protein
MRDPLVLTSAEMLETRINEIHRSNSWLNSPLSATKTAMTPVGPSQQRATSRNVVKPANLAVKDFDCASQERATFLATLIPTNPTNASRIRTDQ